MAIIDFPASPSVGQTFTPLNGATYKWTGVLWMVTTAAQVLPPHTDALYSEQVLATPGNSLQVSIPPPPWKRLSLQMYFWSQDGANHGPGLNIGGIASSAYNLQGVYGAGTNAAGYSSTASFWQIPNGWVHFLTFDFGYSGGGINGMGHFSVLSTTTGRNPYAAAVDVPGTLGGSNTFWCTYTDLANFAAGSYARVFYMP